jgi:ubiquitin-like modifier-activating enzyme ATG7
MTKLLFQPWQARRRCRLALLSWHLPAAERPHPPPPARPQVAAEPALWAALGEAKLRVLCLDEGPLEATATYTASTHAAAAGPLTLAGAALRAPGARGGDADAGAAAAAPPTGCPVAVELRVVNSRDALARLDRPAAAAGAAAVLWADVASGAAERRPALLQRLVLAAHCDLKAHRYTYWAGAPALLPPTPFTLLEPLAPADARLGGAAAAVAACAAFAAANEPFWLLVPGAKGAAAARPLADWAALEEEERARTYLAFLDPSNDPAAPGWPLRNALLLAAARWRARSLRVLCLRARRGRLDANASLALRVALPDVPPGGPPPRVAGGWAPAPVAADLGAAMDPLRLAADAVALNLELMRWRAAPTLDVGALAAARCLCLGAGTLGCAVARALLGWGVRRLTLVDAARVSFSNPVRQSLFTFEDCLGGGRPKAAAAAAALRAIAPGVEAEGVELAIPMPGHPPADAAEATAATAAAARLDALVLGHDAVFLLLDSREARWLPAVAAAARGKLVVTAALGFDDFVVVRHGAPPLRGGADTPWPAEELAELEELEEGGDAEKAEEELGDLAAAPGQAERLGCYFCNDVHAPGDSLTGRALDQQCTVARPGLSGVAGALAAELAVATLAHPAGVAAPAPGAGPAPAEADALPLGEPPHMVRGQLAGFSQACLVGRAFPQCPACSPAAARAYLRGGARFVARAVSEPRYLERLTGLSSLHAAAEAAEAAAAGARAVAASGSDAEDWEEL